MNLSLHEKHVFICCKQRSPEKACCNNDRRGNEAKKYATKRIEALNLQDKIRISSSGCIGRCSEGPVLVIYPDAIWYRYTGLEDIERIIQEHLMHGRIVEHLKV